LSAKHFHIVARQPVRHNTTFDGSNLSLICRGEPHEPEENPMSPRKSPPCNILLRASTPNLTSLADIMISVSDLAQQSAPWRFENQF
jgi:hypothetical protein